MIYFDWPSELDVINRILWDDRFDPDDFIVGYEDRFEGRMEAGVSSWKKDMTHEEFIPQHRVIYIVCRKDGEVVWDRRRRIDRIFNSGNSAYEELNWMTWYLDDEEWRNVKMLRPVFMEEDSKAQAFDTMVVNLLDLTFRINMNEWIWCGPDSLGLTIHRSCIIRSIWEYHITASNIHIAIALVHQSEWTSSVFGKCLPYQVTWEGASSYPAGLSPAPSSYFYLSFPFSFLFSFLAPTPSFSSLKIKLVELPRFSGSNLGNGLAALDQEKAGFFSIVCALTDSRWTRCNSPVSRRR